MTPERYRRASDLFNQFRQLPESNVAAALASACAGDQELLQQVKQLLAADRAATSTDFLRQRALDDAVPLVDPDAFELPAAGTILGTYRLDRRVGSGGMGVVFEAHDLRLRRRVALKILTPAFAAENDQRVRRFQQEARAASMLNHPNIVSVHDAEFQQGRCYIAMEFVEGKTLRQWLTSGALPDSNTLLEWLTQIATALSAAHQANIVHRDIKPENIMVREDGFVKVLDFGLAKLRELEASTGGEDDFLTRPGGLAGTIHYLSPEQILGQSAGPRSDLFSLGIVAYEMATGVRPFTGPTDGAVFNAILHHHPPPPSTQREALGSKLDELILRMLEKDPEMRFQSGIDLRSSCRRISRDYVARMKPDDLSQRPPQPRSPKAPRSRRLLPATALAGVLGCALAALYWLARPSPPPQVESIYGITSDGLEKEYFVTDGTRLYYAAGAQNAHIKVFQVSVKGGETVRMPQLTGMVPLDLSADGSELLLGQYVKEAADEHYRIWAASTLGGAPRRVGDLVADDAHWSHNGESILYTSGYQIRLVRSDGSQAHTLATLPGKLLSPVWSPDGRSVRVTAGGRDGISLWELKADGSNPHQMFSSADHFTREQGDWTPDGRYFVFSAGLNRRDLWAMRESRLIPAGIPAPPARLTHGPLIADRPHPSPDGRRIFFRGRLLKAELVAYSSKASQWIPFLGGVSGTEISYSPDGKWVTYISYPEGSVWRCKADGSQRLQLTAPPVVADLPFWSPDGKQILFYGAAPGEPSRLYLVNAVGGAVHMITHGEAGAFGDESGSWSPDGKSIVFSARGDDQDAHLPHGLPMQMLDLATGHIAPLPNSELLWSSRWSPDGRYIAALRSPDADLWLYEVATHQRRQLLPGGAGWPTWSGDSQYLYSGFGAERIRIRVSDGSIDHPFGPNVKATVLAGNGWTALAPDGSLLVTRDTGSTEIYALDWDIR